MCLAKLLKQFILIYFVFLQNLSNRQKPGCGKGTAVDRARTNVTKWVAVLTV